METVPSSDQAIVDPLKIDGYLLSAAHPIGLAKARFFSRFGFSEDNPKELVDALLGHIRENAVVETQTSPFGVKYRVDGPLTSPDGRNPLVSTIWIVPTEQTAPRFITAFPC